MTRLFLPAVASALVLLVACADVPDFADDRAKNAPYPKIVSTAGILAQVPQSPDQSDFGLGSLASRAAALKARAARLKQRAIVDAATKARMNAALARH